MTTDYSLKAKLYDKYRWHYPISAVNFACKCIPDFENSSVAEFGAGTGILTNDISPYFAKVYAIEPDDNMANILEGKKIKNVDIIRSYSHQVSEIHDNSVTAIFAAHALHWFDYEKTIIEFNRITNQSKILITFSNSDCGASEFSNKTNEIIRTYTDKSMLSKHQMINVNKYYSRYKDYKYEFSQIQNFDDYINGLSSASFLPDSSTPGKYRDFRTELRELFENYYGDGIFENRCMCTVRIGELSSG